MNVTICSLGITFIPIEDMMKQLIVTTTQFMPHILVTENIRIQ